MQIPDWTGNRFLSAPGGSGTHIIDDLKEKGSWV